ncbi:T9SS type A sorting domain-containing protein [Flavobacterium panacagri]|uniref:T9SS type A sorting domain-containing protein n=1 Tax=Flavobacterium panacagri TaxID=3034146 RepID=UPI0025A67726|nr:T9SS type A sorting domain-containing protein [Flavobacterium panacagri]
MKKNYLILIFALLFNTFLFSQTVTLTPTAVNGSNVNSGPINLASTPNSTISLGVKVQFPSNATVNDYGTLKIYYTNLSITNANVAAGGDTGNLLFNGGQVANKSFIINLYWNDFLTTGGFIFAEYKTSTGSIYRSSNLAVIKNATMTGGTTLNPPADAPNPANISNTLCCNQTIRLGDKPEPYKGSVFLNPYKNEPYGINAKWEYKGDIIELDNINQTLSVDYITEPGNFTVQRSLGYVYGNTFPNKSNAITITVVPSPIVTNEISINAPVDSKGYFEIMATNPKQIFGTRQGGQVNLNILQNPNHTPQRGDLTTSIESFEWQYKKINTAKNEWITINSNHAYNLESFIPTDIDEAEDNYYLLRRIATYQNIKRASNTLKIVYRTIRKNNTICCDQTLIISPSNTIDPPSLIIGSDATPETNGYLKYQWQSQSIDSNSGNIGNWINITGATSKDYLPAPLLLVSNSRRGEISWSTPITYNYRRLTIRENSYEPTSYSNEVNLNSLNQYPEISLYPNPASSIINIENKKFAYRSDSTFVSIINSMGETVNSNNVSFITPYLISIDISNLPMGVYFINIQSTPTSSTKLTFIKQ